MSLEPKTGEQMGILGGSASIKRLRGLISKCADSNAAVLIRGPSGSGKELVSRALHNESHRFSQPFVAINCGAIPAQLLESELFGHKKGAFTGATCDRRGRFELAHNGTLFLDEIGDMPLDLQVKFLRVLEERCVEPVGSNQQLSIDVRVIAATHRNLEEMVSAGKFREDLFYRLNILPLSVPALCERSGDIPELILHFAEHYCLGESPINFTRRSMHVLQSYSWPGNVRELSNLMQRLSVLYPSKKIELINISHDLLPSELIALSEQLKSLGRESATSQTEETECFAGEVSDASGGMTLENDINVAQHQSDWNVELVEASDVEKIIELSDSMVKLPEEGIPTREIINDLEANLIRTALNQTSGNVSKAADLLNMGRTSVIQKISKYAIDIE
ncbi:sigma-54 dependent transcriptional regulator [Gammaproteobacteria bacterium]|nr:sigma-54 dependent transcriptional regulator [Gammaproteobacteria bacterium]